jgi:integrase
MDTIQDGVGLMNINSLVDKYYLSSDFNMLADKTKVDYSNCLSVMLNTKIDDKFVYTTKVNKLTGAVARQSYEVWLKRGIYMANHICATSRKVYSFGMEMGYAETNPFSTFKCKVTKPRKVTWTKEQIMQLLDFCYADFQYRSLGLIVQMAYEWCQRIGDMRLLQFDSIDYDKKILNLEQSKRGATVHLPISDDLLEMLIQQKDDYSFQKYVAPYPKALRGSYKPYTLTRLSIVARRAMNLCGLPDELRIADLRRTGTTEMVEAGVSMGQIMSVTGHANPQSVKPYMKNTLDSAKNALTIRKKYDISTDNVPNKELYNI